MNFNLNPTLRKVAIVGTFGKVVQDALMSVATHENERGDVLIDVIIERKRGNRWVLDHETARTSRVEVAKRQATEGFVTSVMQEELHKAEVGHTLVINHWKYEVPR